MDATKLKGKNAKTLKCEKLPEIVCIQKNKGLTIKF